MFGGVKKRYQSSRVRTRAGTLSSINELPTPPITEAADPDIRFLEGRDPSLSTRQSPRRNQTLVTRPVDTDAQAPGDGGNDLVPAFERLQVDPPATQSTALIPYPQIIVTPPDPPEDGITRAIVHPQPSRMEMLLRGDLHHLLEEPSRGVIRRLARAATANNVEDHQDDNPGGETGDDMQD
ncbi:hypothetical protein TWF696_009205 [Orbilia brochopaga]|uniref:Uncharacterized protein n=1 Tax=Orbilia brochopaga TaxID=3140254 RepID=A0AAV9UF87_9PEZI